MDKPKYILLDKRESLAESGISDAATFGFLLICIWASQGSTWWTFCTALMFLFWPIATCGRGLDKRRTKFKSLDDMQAWIDKERSNA